MAKKINIVGKKAEGIQNTGPSLPRIEPSEFAAAIRAEPCGECHSRHLDPISLLALGNELLKRLRSTGGRPSLEGATEQCKVPFRPEEVKALEEISKAIEQETDARPSLGQIASVILKLHLDLLRKQGQTTQELMDQSSKNEAEPLASLNAVKELVEEQLKPVWEELNRMKKVLADPTRSNGRDHQQDRAMGIPGEKELRETIRADLAAELQVTADLLDIGMSIFQPTVRPEPDESVDSFELLICLGLVAKACRQYRGIVALAEISLGEVAESNGRMLLETMLTAEFLMRPTVTLKKDKKQLADVPGYPLSRLLRSRLYLAFDAASMLKTVQGMAGNGDLPREDADRVLKLAESHKKEYYDEIGPEWVKRQQQERGFAGVSIYHLAESLDLLHVYHDFYRPASARVHGSDASRYIEVNERPGGGLMFSATSSTKGVAEALALSSLAVLDILNVTNQRLGLKLDERLSPIAPRIQQMAHRLPDE